MSGHLVYTTTKNSTIVNSDKEVHLLIEYIKGNITQTGDTALPTDEQIYFEVACHVDTKQFAVGITHDSINKFDQLGRTSSSWAVYVNRWMQVCIYMEKLF